MKRYDGPCGDPYCHRGTEIISGPGGAMTYKDGPCDKDGPLPDDKCKWRGPTRPHFTDNPSRLEYDGHGGYRWTW